MPARVRTETATSADVEHAGPAVAEADREGALAVLGVGRDVAQVVRDEDRRGERTHADGAEQAEPRHGIRLRVLRAERGQQAEEDEDVDLAQPAVAVGVVTARVAPRREHGQGAERQHEPRTGERHEGQADDCRPRRSDRSAASRTFDGGGEPLADEPHRPDPRLVGAADAVGVVVGVVDADLEGQCDEQGEDRQGRVGTPEQVGGGGAEDDGGDGGGQGARARAGDPLGQGGHGWGQRSLRKSGSSSGPRGRRSGRSTVRGPRAGSPGDEPGGRADEGEEQDEGQPRDLRAGCARRRPRSGSRPPRSRSSARG